MVKEMARVTRPGGVVAGLNEGVRGVLRGSVNPDQAGEIALGINEHVHSVWAYAAAFTRAGLVVRMAVLYDLLTTGPVAVESTVDVA